MNNIIWFAGGSLFGAFIGVFTMALLSVSRSQDYTEIVTGGDANAGNDNRRND